MAFYNEREHHDAIKQCLLAGDIAADVVQDGTGQWAIKAHLEGGGIVVWSPHNSAVLWSYTVVDAEGNVVDTGKSSITAGEATPDEVAKLIATHEYKLPTKPKAVPADAES